MLIAALRDSFHRVRASIRLITARKLMRLAARIEPDNESSASERTTGPPAHWLRDIQKYGGDPRWMSFVVPAPERSEDGPERPKLRPSNRGSGLDQTGRTLAVSQRGSLAPEDRQPSTDQQFTEVSSEVIASETYPPGAVRSHQTGDESGDPVRIRFRPPSAEGRDTDNSSRQHRQLPVDRDSRSPVPTGRERGSVRIRYRSGNETPRNETSFPQPQEPEDPREPDVPASANADAPAGVTDFGGRRSPAPPDRLSIPGLEAKRESQHEDNPAVNRTVPETWQSTFPHGPRDNRAEPAQPGEGMSVHVHKVHNGDVQPETRPVRALSTSVQTDRSAHQSSASKGYLWPALLPAEREAGGFAQDRTLLARHREEHARRQRLNSEQRGIEWSELPS